MASMDKNDLGYEVCREVLALCGVLRQELLHTKVIFFFPPDLSHAQREVVREERESTCCCLGTNRHGRGSSVRLALAACCLHAGKERGGELSERRMKTGSARTYKNVFNI